MPKQFWVIGADFEDTNFERVAGEHAKAMGPFGSYDDALQIWKQMSVASRPQACTRYCIAATGGQQ